MKNARCLLERISLLFSDRFGLDEINLKVLTKMFVWAYSPYISLDAPVWKSYYKFAVGEHKEIKNNMSLFFDMCEMNNPREFNEVILDDIENRRKRRNKIDIEITKVYDTYFRGI